MELRRMMRAVHSFHRYQGELIVEYDSGEVTVVELLASAGVLDVYLSTPTLQLEPAYIGLCRFVLGKLSTCNGCTLPFVAVRE